MIHAFISRKFLMSWSFSLGPPLSQFSYLINVILYYYRVTYITVVVSLDEEWKHSLFPKHTDTHNVEHWFWIKIPDNFLFSKANNLILGAEYQDIKSGWGVYLARTFSRKKTSKIPFVESTNIRGYHSHTHTVEKTGASTQSWPGSRWIAPAAFVCLCVRYFD